MGVRVDKILSNLGYGSRKEIKAFVKQGRVKINDRIIKDESTHMDSEKDILYLDDTEIKITTNTYIMLNKPNGVVSATYDPVKTTVLQLLDERYQRMKLFPVGRLDIDTEGLLIMTNDGTFSHDLLSPKKHVFKKYYVEVDGKITNDDVSAFEKGIDIGEGYITLPAELEVLEAGILSKTYTKIREGKFHQVKRMFHARGKEVKFLKRVAMGSLKLDENLKPGEYRLMTDEEVNSLKNNTDMPE